VGVGVGQDKKATAGATASASGHRQVQATDFCPVSSEGVRGDLD